jgi:outer membrane lipoprotein SlyB
MQFASGRPLMAAFERRKMKRSVLVAAMLAFTLGGAACVETSTYTRTWNGAPAAWGRPGQVQWIREVVNRQQGNPVGGAIVGALIGGAIGHHGPGALIGAAGGAVIGAAASSGTQEEVHYDMLVRFDDGAAQMFVYGAFPPFQPGSRVVLTPNGLAPM